jgi:hypothetical protein
MKSFRVICLLLCFAGTAMYAQTSSQINSRINTLYHFYADRGDYLISTIRPKFRAVLSAPDQRLEESIRYDTIITGNTNAFATREGTTIVTASMLQIIDSVATMLAASQTFSAPQCLSSYLNYLTESTNENSRLAARSLPPQPVLMAFSFWAARPDVCSGLTEAKFRNSTAADNLRELMIYSSIIYIIGHEFAHHKYGDTQYHMVTDDRYKRELEAGRDVTTFVTPTQQRTKEARADSFAFQKMIEMDFTPIGALPVLLFFSGIEGFSPELTSNADHPAAICRFEEMIEYTDRDPEFKTTINKLHKEPEWQAFEAQLRNVSRNP